MLESHRLGVWRPFPDDQAAVRHPEAKDRSSCKGQEAPPVVRLPCRVAPARQPSIMHGGLGFPLQSWVGQG